MSIIKIENLNFGYVKKQPILKGLNMQIEEGSIYGFLGANGAGKSTTIRNILGLLKPNSGAIELFGKPIQKSGRHIFNNIGSLIESPSLYPHLTARDNLKLACKYLNVSKAQIDHVLDRVKLQNYKKKAVGKFSTGMKQRVGLAMALIHDPQLLILDEPTSGLDPNGITEMRNIILALRNEGRTVMLSSHLLSEIEKMATQVGIINNGEMIFEGSLEELDRLKSDNLRVTFRTNDPDKAVATLSEYDVILNRDGCVELPYRNEDEVASAIRKLVQHQIDIYEVNQLKSDLEKMFIDLTLDAEA